jgi:hypothetical protein
MNTTLRKLLENPDDDTVEELIDSLGQLPVDCRDNEPIFFNLLDVLSHEPTEKIYDDIFRIIAATEPVAICESCGTLTNTCVRHESGAMVCAECDPELAADAELESDAEDNPAIDRFFMQRAWEGR